MSARKGTLDHGSSPLTRGKPTANRSASSFTRLIPAHAGKTFRSGFGPFRAGAHPRSRGENSCSLMWSLPVVGSSPLTRGKRCGQRVPVGYRGLIPAHAGKTRPARLRRSRHPAHPRSRGENAEALVGELCGCGSSPLTRGKRTGRARPRVAGGLIPAHAGKTSSTSPTSWQGWAHPRSRGENRCCASLPWPGAGSSPLTRGKLAGSLRVLTNRGLIPAHAGKTPARPWRPPE